MVIVDTTVWIDYLRGIENAETLWLDGNLQRQRLALTDLILCEVLQGIADRATMEHTEKHLSEFYIFSTGGIELAISAAKNYRDLRLRGHTIRKTIDCLIATFCLQNRHELLHRDRDFDPFERFLDLAVVHPSA